MFALSAAQAKAASVLWNPGPKYHSYVTFTQTFNPFNVGGCLASRSTLMEAHLVGNPGGQSTGSYTCEGYAQVGPASNGARPSVYRTAMVGWTSADHEQYPGWGIWSLSGGNGTPIVTQFLNHAYYATSPCALRENGYSYVNWPYLPDSHFKPSPINSSRRIKLGDYSNVIGKATAKRGYVLGPPTCNSLATGITTIDFRVSYENSSTGAVTPHSLGVVIDEAPGNQDLNGNASDAYFYRDANQAFVYASRIGLPTLSLDNWTEYSIDFKSLLSQYLPPPSGYTINDAYINGYDVYSSVRGADLDFIVKDLDIRGE